MLRTPIVMYVYVIHICLYNTSITRQEVNDGVKQAVLIQERKVICKQCVVLPTVDLRQTFPTVSGCPFPTVSGCPRTCARLSLSLSLGYAIFHAVTPYLV